MATPVRRSIDDHPHLESADHRGNDDKPDDGPPRMLEGSKVERAEGRTAGRARGQERLASTGRRNAQQLGSRRIEEKAPIHRRDAPGEGHRDHQWTARHGGPWPIDRDRRLGASERRHRRCDRERRRCGRDRAEESGDQSEAKGVHRSLRDARPVHQPGKERSKPLRPAADAGADRYFRSRLRPVPLASVGDVAHR